MDESFGEIKLVNSPCISWIQNFGATEETIGNSWERCESEARGMSNDLTWFQKFTRWEGQLANLYYSSDKFSKAIFRVSMITKMMKTVMLRRIWYRSYMRYNSNSLNVLSFCIILWKFVIHDSDGVQTRGRILLIAIKILHTCFCWTSYAW